MKSHVCLTEVSQRDDRLEKKKYVSQAWKDETTVGLLKTKYKVLKLTKKEKVPISQNNINN